MGTHLSTQGELSNEYQHGRVWIIFKNICVKAGSFYLSMVVSGESSLSIGRVNTRDVVVMLGTRVSTHFLSRASVNTGARAEVLVTSAAETTHRTWSGRRAINRTCQEI